MPLFFSGEPLKIINHPKSLSSVSPGTPVSFTVQATEMDQLSYQWQWKPPAEEDEWQPCRAEWCDGATLTIPSVQKSNEGSYRCVISNYAGTLISKSTQLSVGKSKKIVFGYLLKESNTPMFTIFAHILFTADPPKVTIHPCVLKDAVPGKPVMFTAEATGTDPLSYQWLHWKLAGEGGGSGEWQSCPAEWCDGATLTIASVQKSNEGHYCCVISNCAGSQASQPAKLEVS